MANRQKLNRTTKGILRTSSRSGVQVSFSNLSPHIKRNKWLAARNRYIDNCEKKLREDTKSANLVKQTDLAQYISASGPVHCMDGWSFLGKALMCLFLGDSDASRHLGYYAELRAAMSLLATEGIGIFNINNFVVDSNATCTRIPGDKRVLQTHRLTWLTLEHWAGLRRSAKLLGNIISPGHIPLAIWLDSFSGGNILQAIGADWFRTWGLDLHRLSDDREARNISSYRPTRFKHVNSLTAIELSAFARSMWQLFEPSSSRFEMLDRYLLRLSLEQSFFAIKGKSADVAHKDFTDMITKMLDLIQPGGLSQEEWCLFLNRTTQPDDPPLLVEARGKAAIDDAHHHLQVIGRSALMLRVSTGASSNLIQASGINGQHLQFWWRPLAIDHGLVDSINDLENMEDMWADIEIALEQCATWEQANFGNQPSHARWQREQSYPISILGGCERAGLWGMGL